MQSRLGLGAALLAGLVVMGCSDDDTTGSGASSGTELDDADGDGLTDLEE